MKLLVFVALCGLVHGITDDECRVARIQSYDDNGVASMQEDSSDRAHWATKGFDVASNNLNWQEFRSNDGGLGGGASSGDAICSKTQPSKPYCVTYVDPTHTFSVTQTDGTKGPIQFHTKRVCRACDPSRSNKDCDCSLSEDGNYQYCVNQYRSSEALPVVDSDGIPDGETTGSNIWTSAHGVCKEIPENDDEKSCLDIYDGISSASYPTVAMELYGTGRMCGTRDGWTGSCRAGKCYQCQPSQTFETPISGARCATDGYMGDLRWCNTKGEFVETQPAGNQGELNSGVVAVLTIIAFCAIVLLILTCIICCKNRGATSV